MKELKNTSPTEIFRKYRSRKCHTSFYEANITQLPQPNEDIVRKEN